MSEKPQKFSEKSLKIMFLWRAFCKYHRLLSNSSSLVLKSQVVSVFGEIFQKLLQSFSFLRVWCSGLPNCYDTVSNGVVVRALDSQSRAPMPKTTE